MKKSIELTEDDVSDAVEMWLVHNNEIPYGRGINLKINHEVDDRMRGIVHYTFIATEE